MAFARRWTVLAPLALLMVLFSMSGPLARGQEADAPHPAHIHAGSCDNLGDIVAPLADVEEQTAGEVFGADTAVLVKASTTTVDLSLGEILSAPHAINVHESAEEIQNYIACGDIGGRVVDGELVIGLRELNGSGHAGIADLDDLDGQMEVYINLAEFGTTEEGAAEAAPAAATTPPAETPAPAESPAAETPAPATEPAAAPAAAEAPVDIRDFAYSPNPIEIAAGDTVTWTNQDEVPHTATGEDRGVLQSGTIAPGASFSQVFPEAGEFGYFCEFHPNMTGTIVVQ